MPLTTTQQDAALDKRPDDSLNVLVSGKLRTHAAELKSNVNALHDLCRHLHTDPLLGPMIEYAKETGARFSLQIPAGYCSEFVVDHGGLRVASGYYRDEMFTPSMQYYTDAASGGLTAGVIREKALAAVGAFFHRPAGSLDEAKELLSAGNARHQEYHADCHKKAAELVEWMWKAQCSDPVVKEVMELLGVKGIRLNLTMHGEIHTHNPAFRLLSFGMEVGHELIPQLTKDGFKVRHEANLSFPWLSFDTGPSQNTMYEAVKRGLKIENIRSEIRRYAERHLESRKTAD